MEDDSGVEDDLLKEFGPDDKGGEYGDGVEEIEDLSDELNAAIGEIKGASEPQSESQSESESQPESGDDIPGRREPRRKIKRGTPRPSARGRISTGIGRKKSGTLEVTGRAGQRQPGAEIGLFHRRGMSLAVKFSVWISLLIILITAAFGLAVITIFKHKLENEIIRTGYNQALAMEGFCRKAYLEFDEAFRKDGVKPEDYLRKDPGNGQLKDLKKIVEGDPRIYDVAILFSLNPKRWPDRRLMTARDTKSFSPATKFIDVMVDRVDPSVECWKGDYSTSKGTERVYFFGITLKSARSVGDGASDGAEKRFAMAQLILSRKEIDGEVRSLLYKTALFGLVFVGAGIAFSLFLASAVSSPINILVRDMDIVARGDLDHETRSQTSDEIGLLARAFNRMTQNLREARTQEREVERLNSELKLAEEIHARLMPEKLPSLAGYDIFTCYHCAKEVGGDYYDFIPVDQEHLAFVIADVSGKGIPGSMVMGTTRTILLMMANMNLSPADVLAKTNHWVSRDIKRGMFVTAMYVILNVRTRKINVASAGHNPMIIWRAKSRTNELVRPNGIALGFDRGPIFDRTIREESYQLYRGDRVLLYTDGVVECMNDAHQEWGDDALKEFVSQYADSTSKTFVRMLTTELRRHQGNAEQHDDITVTTFRIE